MHSAVRVLDVPLIGLAARGLAGGTAGDSPPNPAWSWHGLQPHFGKIPTMLRPFALCLLLLACSLAAATAPGINMPAGRIAITHDGNQHDPDDIGALPMNAVLLWAAGQTGRLVHLEHSNHLGDNNGSMEQKMMDSAAGSVSRFGLPYGRVFNAQTQLTASIANFKTEAEKSSAADPLWFICSGPMETAWRCLNAVAADKRLYIRCVSHSGWNETHADTTQMTHIWASMKTSFPTVIYYDIIDQNGSDGDNDWNTSRDRWYWMRDSSYEPYRWVFGRDQFSDKFDPSDAGMTWWVMSGGPNGGDERAGWPEAKALLDWKLQQLGGVNQAPLVSAGPDRGISLPASAGLDGTVSDDGLPSGASVASSWSKVSGPGTVTFGNSAAVDTTASFSASGTYVLRLTASDAMLTASDDVTVTVAAAPVTGSGQINAGGAATGTFAADAGFSGGSTYSRTAVIDMAGVADAGPAAIYQSERYGNFTYVVGGLAPGAACTLRLHFAEIYFTAIGKRVFDVSVGGVQVLNDLDIFAVSGAANRALVRDVPATASASGTITVTFTSVVDNAKLSGIEVLGAAAPINQAPVVDAGPSRSVTLPAQATLDGTVSDDGLPSGSLSSVWSKLSGPGTVTFANAAAVDTTAGFSAPGTYVLRLTASDGALSASGDMQVVVDAVPAGQVVASLSLINADTDLPIPGYDPLPANAVLDLTLLPTRNLNLRANTVPATVGSVRFGVDVVASYSVESAAPYALAGDSSGDYKAWTLSLGSHTVTASPFTLSGANGTAGTALGVTFIILDAPPAVSGNG